jgi:hypothetical protein
MLVSYPERDYVALMPSQWADLYRRRSPQTAAIMRLMAAVLEDAMRCYAGIGYWEKNLDTKRRMRQAREAYEWLTCGDDEAVFGFTNICASFGVDAAAVRTAIVAMRADGGASLRRIALPEWRQRRSPRPRG